MLQSKVVQRHQYCASPRLPLLHWQTNMLVPAACQSETPGGVFSACSVAPRALSAVHPHTAQTRILWCAHAGWGVGWTSTPAVPGRVVARMPLPARAGVSQVGTWAGLQLQWRTGLQRLECPFPREPGLVRLVLGLDFNSSDTEMCRGSIPPLRRVSNPTQ